jgi:hypothetical protein
VGLARYSMILDANDTSFRIHGLVQTVERARATSEGNDSVVRDTALERLKINFPDDVFDNPGTWQCAGSCARILKRSISNSAT